MYSKLEASQIRKEFWTSLGLYMRPLPGADGETVNWLNYKTGIKDVYFRMDADNKTASIGIELKHPDHAARKDLYSRLLAMKTMLEEQTGEDWTWDENSLDEHGRPYIRIWTGIGKVNIFNKADWPAIISFLKPRMLALDAFWYEVKDLLG
jgi:hypothetical protein